VIIATAGFIEINRLTIGETGDRPLNAAWMPEGKNLLVTLANGSKTLELEINRQIRESSQIITGSQPAQLAIAPGGSTVVVANRGSGSVTITTLDGARSTEIDVPGPHPHGVAFGQDPTVVYVTYEGDTRTLGGVVAIDVDTGEILWRTEVGSFTLGVAVLP
jgi:sugar lactone lactonase YvrE